MPGYAVYQNGVLTASGTLAIPLGKSLHQRLQLLSLELAKLRCYNSYSNYDILIYEEIAPRRYGGGSAHGHASLLKSVGVTLADSPARTAIGLRPTIWKKLVGPTYVKSDEADAIEMGRIAIEIARGYLEEREARAAKKKGTKK